MIKNTQKYVARHSFLFGGYGKKGVSLQRYPENNLFTLRKKTNTYWKLKKVLCEKRLFFVLFRLLLLFWSCFFFFLFWSCFFFYFLHEQKEKKQKKNVASRRQSQACLSYAEAQHVLFKTRRLHLRGYSEGSRAKAEKTRFAQTGFCFFTPSFPLYALRPSDEAGNLSKLRTLFSYKFPFLIFSF